MSERMRIDVHAKPEPMEDHILEEDIFPFFLEESADILTSINASLHQWDKDNQNQNALTDIKRGYHTLKSAARSIGLLALGHIAYHTELVCQKVSTVENYNQAKLIRLLIFITGSLQECLVSHAQRIPIQNNFYQKIHKVINDFRQEIDL